MKSHQFHDWKSSDFMYEIHGISCMEFIVFHIWNSYYFMEQHGLYQFILCWLLTRSTCGLWHSLVLGIWWSWYSCMWRRLTIQTNWKLMESCFIQEIKHLVALISLFVVTFHNSNQLGAHGNLFRHIHWRLQEIKPVYNKTFGRVDILACGDLSQLKPIGSSWRLLGWLFGSMVVW